LIAARFRAGFCVYGLHNWNAPSWEFDEKAALLMQKQLKQYKRDRWWGRIRDRFVVNILVRLIILAVFGILSLMGVVR